jgi:hypothetical protein
VCLLDFYTAQILTSMAVSIECVSGLIKVTNNNDARWKHEIKCTIPSFTPKQNTDRVVESINTMMTCSPQEESIS